MAVTQQYRESRMISYHALRSTPLFAAHSQSTYHYYLHELQSRECTNTFRVA